MTEHYDLCLTETMNHGTSIDCWCICHPQNQPRSGEPVMFRAAYTSALSLIAGLLAFILLALRVPIESRDIGYYVEGTVILIAFATLCGRNGQ